MLIQYVLIVTLLFIFMQTLARFKRSAISLREFLFWSLLWIVTAIVVLLPQITTFLANYLGVGRGADLVVYGSLIFVFYMIFRLFVRQEKVEKEVSKIVEEMAKRK